jgi:hypothetical protein
MIRMYLPLTVFVFSLVASANAADVRYLLAAGPDESIIQSEPMVEPIEDKAPIQTDAYVTGQYGSGCCGGGHRGLVGNPWSWSHGCCDYQPSCCDGLWDNYCYEKRTRCCRRGGFGGKGGCGSCEKSTCQKGCEPMQKYAPMQKSCGSIQKGCDSTQKIGYRSIFRPISHCTQKYAPTKGSTQKAAPCAQKSYGCGQKSYGCSQQRHYYTPTIKSCCPTRSYFPAHSWCRGYSKAGCYAPAQKCGGCTQKGSCQKGACQKQTCQKGVSQKGSCAKGCGHKSFFGHRGFGKAECGCSDCTGDVYYDGEVIEEAPVEVAPPEITPPAEPTPASFNGNTAANARPWDVPLLPVGFDF